MRNKELIMREGEVFLPEFDPIGSGEDNWS